MNRDVTMAAVRVYNEWRNGRITQKELRRRERAVAAAQGIEPQPLDVELQPQPLRILEALGATGLRSIRFAREVSVRIPPPCCSKPPGMLKLLLLAP